MARLGSTLVAAIFVWLVGLSLAGTPAFARDVKLVVQPQKVSAETGKYVLLPPPASLTEGDAVPLYQKAVQALPGKKSDDQVRQYLKMGIDQMPADEVEQLLRRYVESLRCVAQAVKCRQCNWPAWTPGTYPANVEEHVLIELRGRISGQNRRFNSTTMRIV